MTPAHIRGFLLGMTVLAVGLAAAATRFMTFNTNADSLFFISFSGVAAGLTIIARVFYLAHNRIETNG
jgi:ABC-type uncharacterized transport system permease subunit